MDLRIYKLVKRAIDQADPIHLLEIGAPQDEYESEIREITSRVGECASAEETQTLVHNIFVKWFDEHIAGPKENYRAPAEAIWAGLQSLVKGKVKNKPETE